MIAVRDHLERFGDAAVVVVTFAEGERLREYHQYLALPFPVLADPDRRLYNLVGAERASARAVWSFATLRLYARLLSRGRRARRPTEDIRQLGADVVIGPNGRLRYLALPSRPDRRPPLEELVSALD